jgi:hypothetical protein
MLKSGSNWNLVPLPASSTKGGWERRVESSEIRLGRGTSYSLTRTCIKTNHKVVSPHFGSFLVLGQATGNTNSLDSPWPGLGGSHHLPPYSILCVTPPHLHSNGSFSRDSQGGVSKLSRFGLPGFWAFITPSSDLRLGWVLKQTCSSLQDLSNSVSHSTCTHWDQVDSRLLVVGSQTASLTLGPSFDHNLCCRCPNGSCEAILDIYTSRPFQQYKEHFKARCLTVAIELWVFGSLGGLSSPIFGSVNGDLTLPSKWGCDTSHKEYPLCCNLWTKNCENQLSKKYHIGI